MQCSEYESLETGIRLVISGPKGGENGAWLPMDSEFPFGQRKRSGTKLWWWLHKLLNILKTLNCILYNGDFRLCELYLSKKKYWEFQDNKSRTWSTVRNPSEFGAWVTTHVHPPPPLQCLKPSPFFLLFSNPYCVFSPNLVLCEVWYPLEKETATHSSILAWKIP